jgi:hypothetical protein
MPDVLPEIADDARARSAFLASRRALYRAGRESGTLGLFDSGVTDL